MPHYNNSYSPLPSLSATAATARDLQSHGHKTPSYAMHHFQRLAQQTRDSSPVPGAVDRAYRVPLGNGSYRVNGPDSRNSLDNNRNEMAYSSRDEIHGTHYRQNDDLPHLNDEPQSDVDEQRNDDDDSGVGKEINASVNSESEQGDDIVSGARNATEHTVTSCVAFTIFFITMLTIDSNAHH